MSAFDSSSLYASATEVVREALRLMEVQDRLRQVKFDELRHDVRKGLDGGGSEPWDPEAFKKKARLGLAAKTAARRWGT